MKIIDDKFKLGKNSPNFLFSLSVAVFLGYL